MIDFANVSEDVIYYVEGLGKLIEYGPTDKLFINPVEEQTEAYITGRFG